MIPWNFTLKMVESSWKTFYNKSWRPMSESSPDPHERFAKKLTSKMEEIRWDSFSNSMLSYLDNYEQKITKIICYGIGSIYDSVISLYQYALLLKLKEQLKVLVQIYDPVFTETEKIRIEKDDLKLVSFPSSSHITTSDQTILFYMPHCELYVYEQWLSDLLNSDKARQFLLFGNDLKSYSSPNVHVLLENFDHKVISFGSPFGPREDVFNDCYLQSFTKLS